MTDLTIKNNKEVAALDSFDSFLKPIESDKNLNITYEEFVKYVPRGLLTQTNSSYKKPKDSGYIEGIKEGDIYISNLLLLKESLDFIPLCESQKMISTVDQNKKTLETHVPAPDEVVKWDESTKNKISSVTGKPSQEIVILFGLFRLEGNIWSPLFIPMASSKYTTYTRWVANSVMNSVRREGNIWKIEVVGEINTFNNTDFFNFRITDPQPITQEDHAHISSKWDMIKAIMTSLSDNANLYKKLSEDIVETASETNVIEVDEDMDLSK